MNRIVAVTSALGAQQAAVASAFAAGGWTVRKLDRRAESGDGDRTARADLFTGEGLGQAFDGVDVVAFTTPQDHRPGAMTAMARQVAAAAKQAGVQRLVASVAGAADRKSSQPFAAELRAARDAIRETGIPAVVLEPTVYMDNLLAPWALPGIVSGGVLAYPAPPQAAISWLSRRSLAEFFVAAAGSAEALDRDLPVGGPEALTGPELAAILAEHLGRTIAYHAVPLDQFAAGMNQAFGAPAGDRLAEIYARLAEEPRSMAVDEQSARLLGVQPESFAEFVSRSDWSLPPT